MGFITALSMNWCFRCSFSHFLPHARPFSQSHSLIIPGKWHSMYSGHWWEETNKDLVRQGQNNP